MSTETIWKFRLTDVTNVVNMPACATVLTVGEQDGHITLWARVNPKYTQQPRTFHVVGTGCDVPETAGAHIGTAFIGRFVFHVFAEAVPGDR